MTQFPQAFPGTRMRRLRQAPWARSLVSENVLTPADLVWAVFVHDGEGRMPVASLPGVDRLSVAEAALAAKRARALGIRAIALFPYMGPEGKDADGSGALDEGEVTSTRTVCNGVDAIQPPSGRDSTATGPPSRMTTVGTVGPKNEIR